MTPRKVRLTAAQRAAGRAQMKGDFVRADVEAALVEAGVPARGIVAARAADQLLIEARDAGEVVFVVGKLWRAVG